MTPPDPIFWVDAASGMVGATIPVGNSMHCMWSPYAPLHDRSTHNSSGLHATAALQDCSVRTGIARDERAHKERRLSAPIQPRPDCPSRPLNTSRARRTQWRHPPSRSIHCRHRNCAQRASPSHSELFSCAGRRVRDRRERSRLAWVERVFFEGYREGGEMWCDRFSGTEQDRAVRVGRVGGSVQMGE